MSDLINAYLRHLRAAGRSEETRRSRGAVLRALSAALPAGIDHPTVDEIEAWLAGPADVDDEWSRWTRYTYFEHLNGFYAWAVSRGHLSWSPMDQLVRPEAPKSEPHPATEEQLAIALARLTWPHRTAVLLAAYQSLRAAEIARLRREDIDERWLSVSRKYAREQVLPVHPLVWAEVRGLPRGPELRDARGTAFEPLLYTRRGTPFIPGYLSVATSRRLAAVGLAGLSLHWFRHRFATIALMPRHLGGAGADVRTVQELMGHASVRSTQPYTLVTSEQRRAAIAGLPVPAGVRGGGGPASSLA